MKLIEFLFVMGFIAIFVVLISTMTFCFLTWLFLDKSLEATKKIALPTFSKIKARREKLTPKVSSPEEEEALYERTKVKEGGWDGNGVN